MSQTKKRFWDRSDPAPKPKLSEFGEESMRSIAKEIIIKRYMLIIHFWTYFFVNLLLLGINYAVNRYTGTNYYWCLWCLTGWAIIFSLHIFSYLIYKNGIVSYNSIGIIYHFCIYGTVNPFLVFVNWYSQIGSETIFWWIQWPLGIWTGVFILHLIVYLYTKPHKDQQIGQSWMDRKIEEELKKIKNEE